MKCFNCGKKVKNLKMHQKYCGEITVSDKLTGELPGTISVDPSAQDEEVVWVRGVDGTPTMKILGYKSIGGRMKVTKGEVCLTVGGWKAEVIWVSGLDLQGGFYAIHRPGEEDESVPIYHHKDGTAHAVFSVDEPPRFGKAHPADIKEGKDE